MDNKNKTESIDELKTTNKFPVYLKKKLDQYMVGQEALKTEVCMAIYKHINFGVRNPILLIGPSGCGKTFCFELLKKLKAEGVLPEAYNIMLHEISRVTQSGFTGDEPTSFVEMYRKQCLLEHNSEYKGLIFIDEIDKVIMPSHSSYGENVNSIVQYQLMNIVSGSVVKGVDTSNVLFVLGGAFAQLDELEKEEKKNPIGFVPNVEKGDVLYDSLRDKLISIGAMKEFMGRITSFVRLQKLSALELKVLLLHPTNGIIAKKKNEFAKEGLLLEFSEDTYDDIIKKVEDEALGARSLQNVIDSILRGSEYYAIENDYNKIMITKDSLRTGRPLFSSEKSYKVTQNSVV